MFLDYLADELRWVTKTTYFLALNSTFPKILFSYKTDWIRTSEIYLVHHQLGFTIEINAEPWFIKRWSHCPTTVLFWSCKHEAFIASMESRISILESKCLVLCLSGSDHHAGLLAMSYAAACGSEQTSSGSLWVESRFFHAEGRHAFFINGQEEDRVMDRSPQRLLVCWNSSQRFVSYDTQNNI